MCFWCGSYNLIISFKRRRSLRFAHWILLRFNEAFRGKYFYSTKYEQKSAKFEFLSDLFYLGVLWGRR